MSGEYVDSNESDETAMVGVTRMVPSIDDSRWL